MRREYVEAIEAVRWGWSYWAVLVVPAAMIWGSAAWPKTGCLGFAGACAACWLLLVFHEFRIQDTKVWHAVTDAETSDVTNDTGHVFGAAFAIPGSLVYCSLHAVAAYPLFYAGRRLSRRRRDRRRTTPVPPNAEGADGRPDDWRRWLAESRRRERGPEIDAPD